MSPGHHLRLAAGGVDAGGDGFQRFAAAAGEDDGGAFLGERQGGGLADAAAGAGDPGDLSIKLGHFFLHCWRTCRARLGVLHSIRSALAFRLIPEET